MDILFEEANQALTIYLSGELDHHNAVSAKDRIAMKLSTGCYQAILYHLGGLTFMDSSGIGLVANGCKIASVFGGKIYLYAENPKHLKIFTMANMHELATLITNGEELESIWKLPTK